MSGGDGHHALVREGDDSAEAVLGQRFTLEVDGAVLEAQVEEALDLAERVTFDLLCEFEVVEAQLRVDESGHQVAGSREVGRSDLAHGIHEGSVGRPSAHVEDDERTSGPGRRQRSASSHLCLHPTDPNGHVETVGGQRGLHGAGHLLHGAVGGAHHRGKRHGSFVCDLARETAANLEWDEGVDSEKVLDVDVGDGLGGHLGHGFTDGGQHAPDIGSRLAVCVEEGGDLAHGSHDLLGASCHVDLRRAALTVEDQQAGRDRAV